jgi:hypothetical protein
VSSCLGMNESHRVSASDGASGSGTGMGSSAGARTEGVTKEGLRE